MPRKRKKSDLPLAIRLPRVWAALQLVREHRARIDALIADVDMSSMANIPVMVEVGPSREYHKKPVVDDEFTAPEPVRLSE